MTAGSEAADVGRAVAAAIAAAFPAAGWLNDADGLRRGKAADYVDVASRAGLPPEFAPVVEAVVVSLDDLGALMADGLDFDVGGSEYLCAVAETADDLADSLKWLGWAAGDEMAEEKAAAAVKGCRRRGRRAGRERRPRRAVTLRQPSGRRGGGDGRAVSPSGGGCGGALGLTRW